VAGISKRPRLKLSAEEVEHLSSLRDSRTAPWRETQRARIVLRYHSGENVSQIARAVGMTRKSVDKWISKALAMGSDAALKDAYHRPKEPVIREEAKAWVIHLACSKPKDLGYAAEVWTRSALARHVREHARKAGYASLARAAKATVHRILAEQRRDPEFETKMREVLLVYQEVALQNQKGGMIPVIITVSVDEKPGLQAVANTAPDLPPVPGKHSGLGRDHEYKRLGTCSILAALDLHNGHVTARVERRRRSREFVALLKDLDAHYPAESVIRLIMDNHSAHISKETQAFLASRPNRFQYVLTPKHGSWLNIVETLFGKMARTFLRHIRVQSWEELQTRILQGIAEINAAPVVPRCKKSEALTNLTRG
jgi:transposase-like protein/transposase